MRQVTDAHVLLRQAHFADRFQNWLDREGPRLPGGFAWAGSSASIESRLFHNVEPDDPRADDARLSAENPDGGAAASAIAAGDSFRQEIARCA